MKHTHCMALYTVCKWEILFWKVQLKMWVGIAQLV